MIWRNWLELNLSYSSMIWNHHWNTLFGFILDMIWWRLNRVVHAQEYWSNTNIIHKTCFPAKAYRRNIELLKILPQHCVNSARQDTIFWSSLQPGQLAISCDATMSYIGSIAGCGGVVRNHTGRYLCGFQSNIGEWLVLQVELIAILFGLKLVWANGFNCTWIGSDSSNVINLLEVWCDMNHPCIEVIQEILVVFHCVGNVTWNHVSWEGNEAASTVAKEALSNSSKFTISQSGSQRDGRNKKIKKMVSKKMKNLESRHQRLLKENLEKTKKDKK